MHHLFQGTSRVAFRTLQAILLLLAIMAPVQACADPRRLAWIIANSEYEHFSDLPNPAVDAQSIRRILQISGYSVSIIPNANRATMEQTIESIRTASSRLDQGSVVLVYFAGHGFDVDGINYLVPTDANHSIAEPDSAYVSMLAMTDATAGARGVNGIFLFDACRELPAGMPNGFVQQRAPANTLVGLSTEVGQVAADGVPGAGSPFARMVAYALRYPGITGPRLMQIVQRGLAQSGSDQRPVYFSNLSEELPITAGTDTPAARTAALAWEIYGRGQYREALLLAQQAANAGDAEGMGLLGYLYGAASLPLEGVNANHREARRWLRRAMLGNPSVYEIIWVRYVLRRDPSPSRADRLEAERRANVLARQGDPVAAELVARREYEQSVAAQRGTASWRQHATSAREWYERAAEGGSSEAAFALAEFYRTGWGVDVDLTRSLNYLELAHAGGNLYASVRLARYLLAPTLIHLGDSFPLPDYPPDETQIERSQRALSILEWASPRMASANFLLGLYYLLGAGPSRDNERAFRYFDAYEQQLAARDRVWVDREIEEGAGPALRALRQQFGRARRE